MKTLNVIVEFFGDKLRTLPRANYRPHFVVDGDDRQRGENMLGVEFIELDTTEFDKPCAATVKTLYTGVDYSKLKNGAHFSIVAGATVIGKGYVTE